MKIIGLDRASSITRWEKGSRIPGVQTLLMFHLLYGISVEDFFKRQLEILVPTMKERLTRRIEELKSFPQSPKITRRRAFLEAALIRLDNSSL